MTNNTLKTTPAGLRSLKTVQTARDMDAKIKGAKHAFLRIGETAFAAINVAVVDKWARLIDETYGAGAAVTFTLSDAGLVLECGTSYLRLQAQNVSGIRDAINFEPIVLLAADGVLVVPNVPTKAEMKTRRADAGRARKVEAGRKAAAKATSAVEAARRDYSRASERHARAAAHLATASLPSAVASAVARRTVATLERRLEVMLAAPAADTLDALGITAERPAHAWEASCYCRERRGQWLPAAGPDINPAEVCAECVEQYGTGMVLVRSTAFDAGYAAAFAKYAEAVRRRETYAPKNSWSRTASKERERRADDERRALYGVASVARAALRRFAAWKYAEAVAEAGTYQDCRKVVRAWPGVERELAARRAEAEAAYNAARVALAEAEGVEPSHLVAVREAA